MEIKHGIFKILFNHAGMYIAYFIIYNESNPTPGKSIPNPLF
jgi:hypothetical protein